MTTGNSTHNGWTNYATWRVNLELMDGDDHENVTAQTNVLELSKQLRESTLSYIDEACNDNLVNGWATAFVEEVNFYEIAQHIVDCCDDNA